MRAIVFRTHGRAPTTHLQQTLVHVVIILPTEEVAHILQARGVLIQNLSLSHRQGMQSESCTQPCAPATRNLASMRKRHAEAPPHLEVDQREDRRHVREHRVVPHEPRHDRCGVVGDVVLEHERGEGPSARLLLRPDARRDADADEGRRVARGVRGDVRDSPGVPGLEVPDRLLHRKRQERVALEQPLEHVDVLGAPADLEVVLAWHDTITRPDRVIIPSIRQSQGGGGGRGTYLQLATGVACMHEGAFFCITWHCLFVKIGTRRLRNLPLPLCR